MRKFKNFSEFNYCYIKKFAVPWRNINRLPYRRGNGKINSKALLDVNGVVLYGGAIKCSWEMEDEAPVKGKETAKK